MNGGGPLEDGGAGRRERKRRDPGPYRDTARISIDAFPDRKVNAVVYEIATPAPRRISERREEVTNFTVKDAHPSDPGVTLRPGMSMTADVVDDDEAERSLPSRFSP